MVIFFFAFFCKFEFSFQHIDYEWDRLLKREIKPKFVPVIKDVEDVSNFDKEFTREQPHFSGPKDKRPISEADHRLFEDFDFSTLRLD